MAYFPDLEEVHAKVTELKRVVAELVRRMDQESMLVGMQDDRN